MCKRARNFGMCTGLVLLAILPSVSFGAMLDPTRPAFLTEKKPIVVKRIIQKPLDLTSTLVSSQRKVAIINNQVVLEGDVVDNALVVQISRNYVQVKRGNTAITLKLKASENIKRAVRLSKDVAKE